jgi:transposase
MDLPRDFDALKPEQLCALAAQLIVQVIGQEGEAGEKGRELQYRQTRAAHQSARPRRS